MKMIQNIASRRKLLAAGAATAFAAMGGAEANASSPERPRAPREALRVINICDAPYNADPTGNNNSAPAMQAAFNDLQNAGGGTMIVPPGDFLMEFPVISPNCNISILGAGPSVSVFLVRHNGVAIALNTYNTYDTFVVRDIGFSPVPVGGYTAGIGLSLNYPNSNVGWVRADVSDVCFGVPRTGYTTFAVGMRLENCRRGIFSRVNFHSNIGPAAGTVGVLLTGLCVDNHFDDCFLELADAGLSVSSYCEGLNVCGSVIICNRGIVTGNADYNNGINLLGLYVSDCEFNCAETAVDLFQVAGGSIGETHLSTQSQNSPAASLVKCAIVPITSCSVTGEFNASAPSPYTGVYLAESTGCQVDNSTCTNLLVGVYLDAGTRSSSVAGLRMLAPGLGALVDSPLAYGQYMMTPCVDVSGNPSNFLEWIASGGRRTMRTRRQDRRNRADNSDLVAGLR